MVYLLVYDSRVIDYGSAQKRFVTDVPAMQAPTLESVLDFVTTV